MSDFLQNDPKSERESEKHSELVIRHAEIAQNDLEDQHLVFHHLLRHTTEQNQSLEHLVRALPFIAYALDAVSLGYQLYKETTDKFASKQKKAVTMGSSILQAGLLGTTTGLAIAALVGATAAVATAGAAVYTTFCAIRAIRYITKAADCIRRDQNPAHHLVRKKEKLKKVEEKKSSLKNQLQLKPENKKIQIELEKHEKKAQSLREHIDILNPEKKDDPNNADALKNLKNEARKKMWNNVYNSVMSTGTALGVGLLLAGGLPGITILLSVGAISIIKSGISQSMEGYKNYRLKKLIQPDQGKNAEQLLKNYLTEHYQDPKIQNDENAFSESVKKFTRGLDPKSAQNKIHTTVLTEHDLEQGHTGPAKVKNIGENLVRWTLSGEMFSLIKSHNPVKTVLLSAAKLIHAIVTTPIALLAGAGMYVAGGVGQKIQSALGIKPNKIAPTPSLSSDKTKLDQNDPSSPSIEDKPAVTLGETEKKIQEELHLHGNPLEHNPSDFLSKTPDTVRELREFRETIERNLKESDTEEIGEKKNIESDPLKKSQEDPEKKSFSDNPTSDKQSVEKNKFEFEEEGVQSKKDKPAPEEFHPHPS